ncbi:conserved hypothetical protein [Neospora caninum Liverpool]|uniref:Transmembrane protein n=1 Tax=Neospora caninum (strain Liverpool) TaxID=572307 RepID=F0VRB0_NEOCL|nr:conserved hypothetical protein [Neospora caninum Liverpool]CBZ56258.1 conserved hypothetical protein [Neospora caninum Liverpool]|eukprot:XP_003886283.1 conserved hypothetical protein [Neospora caninum Liverpool]
MEGNPCSVVSHTATKHRNRGSVRPVCSFVSYLSLFVLAASLTLCSEWGNSVYTVSPACALVHFAAAASQGENPEGAASSSTAGKAAESSLDRSSTSSGENGAGDGSSKSPSPDPPDGGNEAGRSASASRAAAPASAFSRVSTEKFLADRWLGSENPLHRRMCESMNADPKLAKQFILLALLLVQFSEDEATPEGRRWDMKESVKFGQATELLHRLLVDAHAEPSRRSGFFWQNAEPCEINTIAGKQVTLVAVRLFEAIQASRGSPPATSGDESPGDVSAERPQASESEAAKAGDANGPPASVAQYWARWYKEAKQSTSEDDKKTAKTASGGNGTQRSARTAPGGKSAQSATRDATPSGDQKEAGVQRDSEGSRAADASAEDFPMGDGTFAYHAFIVRLMEEEQVESKMWSTQDILKFSRRTRISLRPGETLPELINHATSIWSSYLIVRRLQTGDAMETMLADWVVGPVVASTTGAFQDAVSLVSDAVREPIMDEPVCGHIFLLLDGFRSSPLASVFIEGSTTATQLEQFRQYLLSVLVSELEKAVQQLAEDLRLLRKDPFRRPRKAPRTRRVAASTSTDDGAEGAEGADALAAEAVPRVTRKQLPITRLAGYVVKLGSGIFQSGVLGEGNSYEANQRLLQAMTSDSMLVEIQFFNEGNRSLHNAANPLVSLPEQPILERGAHLGEARNLRNGVEDERDEAANILRNPDSLLSAPDWTGGDPDAVVPVVTAMKALKRHINGAKGALPIWFFRRSFVIYSTIEGGDVTDTLGSHLGLPFTTDYDIHFFVYVPISSYSSNVGEKLRKSFLLMAQAPAAGANWGLSGVDPVVDDCRIKELGTAKLTDDGQALKLKTFGIGLDDNQRTNVQKFIQRDMVLIHYKIKGLASMRSSLTPGEEWRIMRAEKMFARILKQCRNLLEVPYAVVVKKQNHVETRQAKKSAEVEGGLPPWVLAIAVVCTAVPLIVFMCCLQFHKRLPLPWWLTCICSSSPPWEASRDAEEQDMQSVVHSQCLTQADLCMLYDVPSVSEAGSLAGSSASRPKGSSAVGSPQRRSPRNGHGSRMTSRSGALSPVSGGGKSAWMSGASLAAGPVPSGTTLRNGPRGGWLDSTGRWVTSQVCAEPGAASRLSTGGGRDGQVGLGGPFGSAEAGYQAQRDGASQTGRMRESVRSEKSPNATACVAEEGSSSLSAVPTGLGRPCLTERAAPGKPRSPRSPSGGAGSEE